MPGAVFLCYRREDSSYETTYIHERLERAFGAENVFMDVDTIPAGVDFRTYLEAEVARCNVMLVMIGRDWLVDRSGNRRLDDPRDFVRIEIEAAFERNVRLVPVLVGEASMPQPDELPESLRDLPFRQAVRVRPGRDFHRDMDGLIRALDESMDQRLSELAAGCIERGNACYDEDDLDEAIAEYSRAIQLDPQNAEIYCLRAKAYAHFQKRDVDQAIEDCNEAIRLDPEYAEAYFNRGVAYYDKGITWCDDDDGNYGEEEVDRALEDFNKAIQLDPENAAEAYYYRAIAYNVKDQLDQSMADFTEAIRLDPELAEAYHFRGEAYQEKGDLDRAIDDYTEEIRLTPEDYMAYDSRGDAYREKGDLDRAIADYCEAVRLDPEYVLPYYHRGKAHYGKGEFDRAVADYNEAVRLDPEYADVYHDRGLAYQKMGRDAEAERDFATARKLGYEPE